MRKNAAIIVTILLAASAAFAGMGGGMSGGGTTGMPGRPGGQVPAEMGNGMNGMALVVADDGTVFTTRRIAGDPDVPGSGTLEVLAISPSGVTLWTLTAAGPVLGLEIAGDLLLVTEMVEGFDHMPADPQNGMDHDQSLLALSINSGTEIWRVPFEGRVMNLEPSPSAIYVVVADHDLGTSTAIVPRGGMHSPGTGQAMGNLELFAISLDGSVLWTVPLSQ